MAEGINTTTIKLPSSVSSDIIQKLQENSAVMRLARKIDLPGNGVTIPVITGDPEAAWVAETDKKKVSKPGLGTKLMSAYTLAVIVPFSNQFKRNAEALYEALVDRLPLALAQKFDYTVFGGVAAPGENFDTLATATAQDLKTDVYKGLVAADANKRPLFVNSAADGAVPMLLSVPTVSSKGAFVDGTPKTLGFAGDWTQAVYGTVEGVQISISDQATLTDGSTTINLWQQNMFAVRAEIEIGFRCDKSVFNKLTKSA